MKTIAGYHPYVSRIGSSNWLPTFLHLVKIVFDGFLKRVQAKTIIVVP